MSESEIVQKTKQHQHQNHESKIDLEQSTRPSSQNAEDKAPVHSHDKEGDSKQGNQDKGEQPEEVESDCEDCRREREENNRLIDMYQKLRSLETKVEKVQTGIKEYVEDTSGHTSKLSNVESQIKTLESCRDNQQHIITNPDLIGIQLASQVIEKSAKNKSLEQENRLLKQTINRMRQEKIVLTQKLQQNTNSKIRDPFKQSGSAFTTAEAQDRLVDSTPQTEETPVTVRTQYTTLKNQNSNPDDTLSTQYLFSNSSRWEQSPIISSSLLNLESKRKNSIRQEQLIKPKLPDMSLWLFQSEQNAKLQNALYAKPQKSARVESSSPVKNTLTNSGMLSKNSFLHNNSSRANNSSRYTSSKAQNASVNLGEGSLPLLEQKGSNTSRRAERGNGSYYIQSRLPSITRRRTKDNS